MKYITRAVLSVLHQKLQRGKVVVVLGARRVGKTELLHAFVKTLHGHRYLFMNGEDQNTIDILQNRSKANYARLLNGLEYLIIDEAQHIPEIGLKLKFIVDTFQDVYVIATGSSAFDLNQNMGQPLVGRQKVVHLYPLAQLEFAKSESLIDTTGNLEERLLYGAYPELTQLTTIAQKQEYLNGIVNDYLLRDILAFNSIRKADKILDLLRLIALQIGKEISIDELAVNLKGISRNTVELYLDLLEKVFIIYRIGGYSNNLRKEISKAKRWYFYDNGIRNALIKNFNALNLRQDIGDLWENYLMSERIKFLSYNQQMANQYFWRTYDQQEIDLVEERGNQLNGYEFKWNDRKKSRAPKGWQRTYPSATFQVINPSNYLDFIGA
jgi:predicted AAA+ superfamily ATPase